jgi:hypothetical protein
MFIFYYKLKLTVKSAALESLGVLFIKQSDGNNGLTDGVSVFQELRVESRD